MQAWPVSIPIPFEAGYDIYEHSKASDVSEPTEWSLLLLWYGAS